MSFERILIANRGEIACRIARTARRMGIFTAAIHSEADEGAAHVRMADEAVCVGPPPSAESYLDIDAVVEAARSTGADAVHPGYGFLSENAQFVEALAAPESPSSGRPRPRSGRWGTRSSPAGSPATRGSTRCRGWTGRSATWRRRSRRRRGSAIPSCSRPRPAAAARGCGSRPDEDEVREGFRGATNEAVASFGDGRIFVERYVERPRHIEIQVLGDRHGTVLHLGERECSVQRRHQKVLEEAPSPFVDEPMRARMGAQAVALARAAGYVSAGTVEFIVDEERRFYFLEMNTRLQVEHPVTEAVTGLDLVEWMIRIAAGEALPFAQDDVRMDGWAMEARVYAEDPERDFLPATGRLLRYRPPRTGAGPAGGWAWDAGDAGAAEDHAAAAGGAQGAGGALGPQPPTVPATGVRVDDGVEEGGEIAVWYDPMIAKLVTSGRDRDEALDRLETALDRYTVRGVTTNLPFLAALARHPAFRAGDLSTAFIDEHFPDGFSAARVAPPEPAHLVAVAAWMQREIDRLNAAVGSPTGTGAGAEAGDGAGAVPGGVEREYAVLVGGEAAAGEEDRGERTHPVSLRRGAGRVVEVELKEERTRYRVESAWRPGLDCFEGTVNGAPLGVQVERRGHGFRLTHAGHADLYRVLSPRVAALRALMPVKRPPDLSRFLLAPMPGLLVRVAVGPGDRVKAGQELAVMEAMKMENVLRAEQDGTVAAVLAEPGTSVAVDQPIMEFEAT